MLAADQLRDGDLVARCRAGDEAAWAALVRRYSRYVHAIATQAFRLSDADAEDVFQEAFARTFQHLGRLRDDEAIKPWLAQTARRLCVDRLRAGGREPVTAGELPEQADAAAEQVLAEIDEALDVRAAMAGMSENCAEILDRFFARDESYRTIAAELDIPPGTIASRISRCLARLRELLEGRSAPAGASGGHEAHG